MRAFKKYLPAVIAVSVLTVPVLAQTNDVVDVGALVDAGTTVWDAVKALVIAIVGFTILVKVVKAFRK